MLLFRETITITTLIITLMHTGCEMKRRENLAENGLHSLRIVSEMLLIRVTNDKIKFQSAPKAKI